MKKGELSCDILSISGILMCLFLKEKGVTHPRYCYFPNSVLV